MNSPDDIRIERTSLLTPLRMLLTFTVVISAYDTGQAVLSFIELAKQPGMDTMLVLIWLLSAPMSFSVSGVSDGQFICISVSFSALSMFIDIFTVSPPLYKILSH